MKLVSPVISVLIALACLLSAKQVTCHAASTMAHDHRCIMYLTGFVYTSFPVLKASHPSSRCIANISCFLTTNTSSPALHTYSSLLSAQIYFTWISSLPIMIFRCPSTRFAKEHLPAQKSPLPSAVGGIQRGSKPRPRTRLRDANGHKRSRKWSNSLVLTVLILIGNIRGNTRTRTLRKME